MASLTRKNLMVGAEALRALAVSRGTSESAAVRDAVAVALGLERAVAAVEGLHAIGAFAEFEERLGYQPEPSAAAPGRARRAPVGNAAPA